MNMKKSIAGVMAGAMAVSAMATVVSADQDAISLSYDLKTYVLDNNKTKAKATVVANYEGSLITEESMQAGYVTFGADNGYVLGGKIYNANGVEIGDMSSTMSMKEFEFTARPYKDVLNDLEEKYQTFKATADIANVDGALYDPGTDYYGYWDANNSFYVNSYRGLDKKYYNMPISATGEAGKFDLRKYDLYALGYSDGANAEAAGLNAAVTKTTYGVRDAVAKMTYEIPNVVKLNKANGWGWNHDLTAADVDGVASEFYNDTLYRDVTMDAETFGGGFLTSTKGVKKGTISTALDATTVVTIKGVDTTISLSDPDDLAKVGLARYNTALASKPTTVAVGAFTAGATEEAVWPFKTTLNPKGKENDVIAALQSRKLGGNYYTKPVAVLNDAIANHDNVVFTFTSYNGYVGTEKSHLMNQWVNVGQGYDYETSGKGYDWHNPTFGQHLYTNLDDSYSLFDTDNYDMYGSYSSAWGINLFTGAVVVNSGLTMQLNDTDTFNWGNNTLSFDWFDITDEGKITDAKTFLKSMLLYTPVDWYWESLDVVVSDEEEDKIDAGEGLDGEGDVIEDEEPVEDIVEETEAEPEVEETEAETEAAPVETAPSPATGNAPVALAVIPVALAAAAVVAKKRG